MKKILVPLFMILAMNAAALYADDDIETNDEMPTAEYILGYWGTSESSFEDAETSGEYVEVNEEGVLRFFKLTDNGEEDQMTFNWVLDGNTLNLYSEGELVIEATIEIVEEGRMIWTNQDGEKLFLIVGAG